MSIPNRRRPAGTESACPTQEQHDLVFTVFPDPKARGRTEMAMRWGDFIAWLHGQPAGEKAKAELVKLATFSGEATATGCLRHDPAVVAVTGIEGDYDAGWMTPASAVRLLDAAGIMAAVVTTHSHTPEKPRWRVFAPLATPCEPTARKRLVAALDTVLGGVLARESYTLSQAFYVGRPAAGEYLVLPTAGGWCIDQCPKLLPPAEEPAAEEGDDLLSAVNATQSAELAEETSANVARVKSALAALPSARPRTDWLMVLHALHGTGWECAEKIAREWSLAGGYADGKDAFAQVWRTAKVDRAVGSRATLGSLFHLAESAGWRRPAATLPSQNLGDIENGRRFAEAYRGRFIHLHAEQRWLAWDGLRWAEGSAQVEQAGKRLLDEVLRAATDRVVADGSDEARRELKAATALHGSARRLADMLKMAATEPGMFEESRRVFDADPWLLGVRNGVINLQTGDLRPANPGLLITKQAGAAFDPLAECPRWRQLLAEVLEDADRIEWVQRWAGYMLTGHVREELAVFALGTGANGKSTVADVLRSLVGEYGARVAPAVLTRGADQEAARHIASLEGRRLALVSELDAAAVWSDGRFKELVSDEEVAGRRLYAEAHSFRPAHKLFVAANHAPGALDHSDGMWRRIALLEFKRTIPAKRRDTALREKLLAELPGILNWALDGCLRWAMVGLRPLPASMQEATDHYRDDTDVLGEWLEACCKRGRGLEAPVGDLHESYSHWLLRAGMKPVARPQFGRLLSARGVRAGRKTARARYYVGLRLKDEETGPDSLGDWDDLDEGDELI